jgi:hypothetical protein
MRFLEALLFLGACSSDYSLGNLPQAETPTLLTGGGSPSSDIYATDGRSLLTLSAVTGAFSQVAPFVGCDLTVVEITINETGEMFAAGFQDGRAALYQVDPRTAACTVVGKRFTTSAPWAVGFLANERLVGDAAGSVMLLDAVQGTQAILGIGAQSRESARDIVVAPSGKTYVSSLLDWSDPASANVLEEIDPKTGTVLQSTDLGGGEVIEGLAVWDGDIHGFGANGTVFILNVSPTSVTRVPIPTTHGPAHLTGAASHPRPDLVPH